MVFDSTVFFLSCSLLFHGYSKNLCRHKRGTKHCMKNLHRYNLKSLIFKHSLLFIHTFKNTTQPLKIVFCKPIANKCYISSFNLFHLVQTSVYSCYASVNSSCVQLPTPGLIPGTLPFFSYGWQIPGGGGT